MNNLVTSVYRNLTKKCWSVKQKGKVIKRPNAVKLYNAKFRVSESGMRKVVSERKKYVHAVIQSKCRPGAPGIERKDEAALNGSVRVSYNPYEEKPYFWRVDTGQEVTEALRVDLLPDGKTVLAYGIVEGERNAYE